MMSVVGAVEGKMKRYRREQPLNLGQISMSVVVAVQDNETR